MKKSFLSLLICLILAFTMVMASCQTNAPSRPSVTPPSASSPAESSAPISSTPSSAPSSVAKPSSSQQVEQSSSSIEILDPTTSNSSAGVVNPSVNSQINSGASAVNPNVSGTSSSSSSASSSSSVWLPDINDYDSNPTPNYNTGFDSTKKYDYSGVTYTKKQGGFTTSGTTYTTNAANTIAVNTNSATPFPYGTISVDLTYVGGDSGIIFGYNNTGSNTWEGSGVSFYFLFINSTYFHLGKSTNGTWETKGAQYMGNNDTQHTYNLKVVLISNKIIGIIDNLVAFTIVDNAFLTGTGFGFRAGVSGTKFSNLTVTNNFVFENENYKLDNGVNYTYPTTYTTLQGGFTTSGSNHTSTAANSLMINTTPFRYGSIQVNLKASNSSDNGIVFAYSNSGSATWEGNGLSYYFLFVNFQGIVILGKTDNNAWSTVGQGGVAVKDFSVAHKLTLIYKEREIKVYLDDALQFTCYDPAPLFGSGYGIRAGGNGVAYTDFTITSDYLK